MPQRPDEHGLLGRLRGSMFDGCNSGLVPVTRSTSSQNNPATICTTLWSLASYATSATVPSFTSAKDPGAAMGETSGSAAKMVR